MGLTEVDSCRHNLLLTGRYGYFLSDPPLSLEASPPLAVSIHPQGNLPCGIDLNVYCFLTVDPAKAFFFFLLFAFGQLFKHGAVSDSTGLQFFSHASIMAVGMAMPFC